MPTIVVSIGCLAVLILMWSILVDLRRPDLRVDCKWCGKFLHGNPKSKVVSHGVCQPCARKALANAEAEIANRK